jgi:hypothetical protein
MSARMAMVGPLPVPIWPTTPVRPTPVLTSMPSSVSVSATSADVLNSWNPKFGMGVNVAPQANEFVV